MSVAAIRSLVHRRIVTARTRLRALSTRARGVFSRHPGETRLLVVVLFGAGLFGAYAWLVEPRWLQVTRTSICLPGRPAAFDGLRNALLSDLHLGRGTPRSLIRRACRRAMAARPDLIALTGDFVDADARLFRPVLDVLGTLTAPLGVYAVPGNHDHKAGIDCWRRELSRYRQIVDLTNRAIMLEVHGRRLCLAGVDDFSRGMPRVSMLPPAAHRDCTILLAHNPDQAEHLNGVDGRVDLVLSGHTHGGQVRLPWLGALRNPARHDDLYEQGLIRRPWATVYVSRGIGTSLLPIRALSRPEVALLELVVPAQA